MSLRGPVTSVGRWPTIALLAIVLLLSACGSSESDGDSGEAQPRAESGDTAAATDTAGSGGTLSIGMSAGNIPIPDTPPNEGFEGRRFVGWQVYDALFNYNVYQGNTLAVPEPALAESYTIGDDKLTWTFQLRQGVKFHDGTAFDADAVMFQMNRVWNKDFEFFSPELRALNTGVFAQIESYRASGPYTIEIKTKIPYAFLTYDLALLYIPSPTAVKTFGNKEYPRHAIGTGPFKITKYVDGQVMELAPNTEYWGTKPKLDKLVLFPIPDPSTRLAALQSGQINWAEVPPPDSVEQLRAQGYNVLLKEYPHVITYQLNLSKPPLDNVKVRQALNYAMDRAGLVQLLNGVAKPAGQYGSSGQAYYDPSWPGYTYDPEKAKALLAEAGHADGFKMTVAYPTSGSGNMWPGPMNEKFQLDLKAIGVDVELVPLEWNNITTANRVGFRSPDWAKYDAFFISLAPYAPVSLASYTAARIPPGGCCNATGYSSPEVERLYAAAQTEFDPAQQLQYMRQMQSAMMKDAPVITTVADLNLRVLSANVRGFVQPQSWFVALNSVWVRP